MKTVRMMVLLLTVMAATAAMANTFTAEGGLLEPTHGYRTLVDRSIVNDGDFEGGTCLETPIWTCTTDNTCDWIADLVPLGLWNYSGAHVAWLGGFCGEATVYTRICQDVDFTYNGCGGFSWFWMGYISNGGELITITVDGTVIFTYYTDINDHLLDYQPNMADVSVYSGVHTLCFNYDLVVAGDNYFVDYVEMGMFNPTPTGEFTFSLVKSFYK